MKGSTVLKRSLSLVLTVVMLFSCWVFTAPSASAASYQTTYKYRVYCNCTNGFTGSMKITIKGKPSNGTGSEANIVTDASIGCGSGSWADKEGSTYYPSESGTTTSYFPTGFSYRIDKSSGWIVTYGRASVTLQMYDFRQDKWLDCCSHDDGNFRSYASGSPSTSLGYPYAYSTSVTGGDTSINVPTGTGTNSTNAFGAGKVYDQYNVEWKDSATLSCDTSAVWNSQTKKISVTNANNASVDYDVKVTATCGNAKATKTCSIKTFDYKVTFYDEDGKKVLKAEQTVDYGASATAPSNPTKAADNQRKYTFDKWTGDGYTTIKTGAQTKKVIASYKNGADWDYTIKYYNGNNGLLDTDTIHYDQTLSVPTNAAKASTAEYDFEFKGWKEGTSSTYNEAGTDTCVTLNDSMTPADLSLNKDNRAKN